ncbi:uncharacterized protein [Miscanthus floridulus]|uniref:uncharacterized protein isoform X2 n=1 Tax=Miscanthus floridulus TaxID=154761 RepID=UPI00345A523F
MCVDGTNGADGAVSSPSRNLACPPRPAPQQGPQNICSFSPSSPSFPNPRPLPSDAPASGAAPGMAALPAAVRAPSPTRPRVQEFPGPSSPSRAAGSAPASGGGRPLPLPLTRQRLRSVDRPILRLRTWAAAPNPPLPSCSPLAVGPHQRRWERSSASVAAPRGAARAPMGAALLQMERMAQIFHDYLLLLEPANATLILNELCEIRLHRIMRLARHHRSQPAAASCCHALLWSHRYVCRASHAIPEHVLSQPFQTRAQLYDIVSCFCE